jgi:hypothetical protein
MPDERADRAAALWPELALLPTRLIQARKGGSEIDSGPRGAGLEAARQRLRRIGALSDGGGGKASGWEGADLRLELMEAARECGADTDPRGGRYLLLDRADGIPEEDFEELNRLGFGASIEELRFAVESHRRQLERLVGHPSEADR